MTKDGMKKYKLTSEVSYKECYTGAVKYGCSGCMACFSWVA